VRHNQENYSWLTGDNDISAHRCRREVPIVVEDIDTRQCYWKNTLCTDSEVSLAIGVEVTSDHSVSPNCPVPTSPVTLSFLAGKTRIRPETSRQGRLGLKLPSEIVTSFVEIGAAGVGGIPSSSNSQVDFAISIEIARSQERYPK
jgi:hypothetical protein